jgi:hypothetical protein
MRTFECNRLIMNSLRRTVCCAAILVVLSFCCTLVANAEPAWRDADGVWWNNMCRASSGAWWLYPPEDAQPVGTTCRIPGTGELGVVTMR